MNQDSLNNSLPQLTPENFLCSSNNSVQLICVNSLCQKRALVCRNPSCQCIKIEHKKCKFLDASLFFKDLFKRRKLLPLDSPSKKALQQIRQCIQQAFQILSQIRQSLDVFQANFGWDQIESRMVQLLSNNQIDQISGKMISCINLKVKANKQKDLQKKQSKYFSNQWNYQYVRRFENQNQIQFMNKWVHNYKKKFMNFLEQQLGWFTKYMKPTNELINHHPYIGKNGLEKKFIKLTKNKGWIQYSTMLRKGRQVKSVRYLQLSRVLGQPKINKNLSALINLKVLDLSYNKITKIQNLKFPQLVELNLHYNHILKIQNLNNVPLLQNLRLDHNKINKIENLEHLDLIQSINLDYNYIYYLDNLQNLRKLKVLFLIQNPAIQTFQGGGGANLRVAQPCLKSLVENKVKIVMTTNGSKYGQINYNKPVFF